MHKEKGTRESRREKYAGKRAVGRTLNRRKRKGVGGQSAKAQKPSGPKSKNTGRGGGGEGGGDLGSN